MKALLNKKKIKQIMFLKGFSNRSLAKTVSASQEYISQIVNGKKSPSAKITLKIANALDTKTEDIVVFIESEDE